MNAATTVNVGTRIYIFRIYDIYISVNNNPCYLGPSSRFGLRIPLSRWRSAGERLSRIPDQGGRPSVHGPSSATAGELVKTAAPRASTAGRSNAPRGRRKGDAKFSCLQRIEKAQKVEIFSAAEDGLGATNQVGGAPLVAVFASTAGRRCLPPRSG
jgi:hypothetical protein